MWDYSVEYFGTRVASRTENDIFSAVDRLECFPHLDSVIEEISNDIREYRRINISKSLSVSTELKMTPYILCLFGTTAVLCTIYIIFSTTYNPFFKLSRYNQLIRLLHKEISFLALPDVTPRYTPTATSVFPLIQNRLYTKKF